MRRSAGALVLALVGVTSLVIAVGADPTAADDWRAVLERAGEAARSTTYEGQALWVTFTPERPYVSTVTVASDGQGAMVVDAAERYRLRVGHEDGDLEHRAEGWVMPLPAALDDGGRRMAALEENYDVRSEGTQRVMDRPATLLALYASASGDLRERLWIDDDTGLLLRRESYGTDGSVARLATYLDLDLDPDPPDTEDGTVLEERIKGVAPVDELGFDALREAGWTVPEELPGGFEAVGAYVVSSESSQPLHLVYTDGLYTVSMFQQTGTPQWDSLPSGARLVEDLPGRVYEWPGALPHRLVWAAAGRTWSVVGDPTPEQLREIARALPHADEPGVLERLRRGFSRLWSWMTEWG